MRRAVREGCSGALRLGRGDLLGHSSCQTNPTSQSRDRRAAPPRPRRRPPGWLGSLPGPRVQKPAWHGLSGGGTGTGPLPVLPAWREGGRPANGQAEAPSAGVPAQVGRGTASGPAPRAPQGPPPVLPQLGLWVGARGAGFSWGRLATSVPPPGPGRGGHGVENAFFTVWRRWEGAQMREVGASG